MFEQGIAWQVRALCTVCRAGELLVAWSLLKPLILQAVTYLPLTNTVELQW